MEGQAYALVHGDDINVSVEESITEDDTANATFTGVNTNHCTTEMVQVTHRNYREYETNDVGAKNAHICTLTR